ncbi:unnamed protein product [Adineta steineri]|uniref:Uncharacterized protein n=1 Tax=Adineta steineri TaxID=433720 RepID=A0A814N5S6_9BILA|nr:unnamed protein product [Adineta steineri]
MENNTKSEVELSDYQIQAARLNKREYCRLERNINLMYGDLQQRLILLKRQERYLRCHYTNVVKVVKPNRRYQLWKQEHAYEIKQAERKDLIESIEFKQKSQFKTHQQQLIPSNEFSSRPLLLLLQDNNVERSIEPLIDFTENFLRPKTSSIDKRRIHSMKITNPILPSKISTDVRKLIQDKSNPVQKIRIEEFASQHRTRKGIMRSTSSMK